MRELYTIECRDIIIITLISLRRDVLHALCDRLNRTLPERFADILLRALRLTERNSYLAHRARGAIWPAEILM
jgi:hypothetical protein